MTGICPKCGMTGELHTSHNGGVPLTACVECWRRIRAQVCMW